MPNGSPLPPRYVNAPVNILFGRGAWANTSESVRITALKFLALAWDNERGESPPMSFAEVMELFGLSQTVLYGHVAFLRGRGLLLLVSAGTARYVFSIVTDDSQIRENAISDSDSSDSTKPRNKTAFSENGKSSQTAEIPMKCATREITDEYERLLGHKVANWAAGEGKAAKQIAMEWSVAEFRQCYRYYKAMAFWKDKRLSLAYIAKNIADYYAWYRSQSHATDRKPTQATSPKNTAVAARVSERIRQRSGVS